MAKQTKKQFVRSAIRKHFGHCDLAKVRKHLKDKAKFEYGCFFYEENIGNGVKLSYTSNPNHFSTYTAYLQCVGFVDSSALTKSDLTKAGIERGAGNHYLK